MHNPTVKYQMKFRFFNYIKLIPQYSEFHDTEKYLSYEIIVTNTSDIL